MKIRLKYRSVNDYCREKFGKKLYKLSLDGGFTCPNRDGTKGERGCIFCSAAGSGDFAGRGVTVDEQIEDAKRKIAAKNKDGGYIAYFQAFTNTYAPVKRLRELYYPVINRPDIDVLDIATRPDCLSDGVIELLKELNGIKPVWVELGLQTTKEESVGFIRRGYENAEYFSAVGRLKKAGIYVIAHMIIGLPGESVEDMKKTLTDIVSSGADGVKLQLLHVLTDSDLYDYWKNGDFETLSMEEYLRILQTLLPLVPPEMTVHRLTGDGNKKYLASPMWSADKKAVINSIIKE